MNLGNQHIDFEVLAGLYLSGNASSEEVEMLELLVKSDAEKRKQFFEIKRSWMLAASPKYNFDKDKAWEKIAALTVNQQGEKIKPLYPRRLIKTVMRIAAAALILIVGTYVALYFAKHREKAIVADNKVVEYIFEDNSKVSLSYNSTIKYPAKFTSTERRIKLEGEAYFEVEKSDNKPFIVETHNAEIVVLGTSFWVKARKDDPETEVVVYSGRVALITPEMNRVEITPGNKGVYNIELTVPEVLENINPNIISWKTKHIVFENTNLKEVFSVINSTYGSSIKIRDSVLEECVLTATFSDRSLEDMLSIIKETFEIRYVRSEGVIYVIGEGCK